MNFIANMQILIRKNKQLQAENQSFKNVLAIIHRDGGHYVAKHGHKKAAADAVIKYRQIQTEIKELKERIEFAVDYLPECPDQAKSFLAPALNGE